MAFCKFSTEYSPNKNIVVDSVFVRDYMPFAPEVCTKVYLYGLYKCANPDDVTNVLDIFAEELNMHIEDVKSAFLFWQEQGLVTVLNLNPIEVRYLPVRSKKYTAKMFSTEKYEDFNKSIQEIIDGRMITPSEYKEYYIAMESLHIDETAMLMIAKYCTNQKGNNVGYNYILTVAKNWAYEGVRSSQDVENKIGQMENVTSVVKDVLVALKSKKQPTFEDKEMFNKWTKQFGYDVETLIKIAKTIKRGGIAKLDELIDEYYSNKLFSFEEIENYEKNKNNLNELAKETCKALGLYYQNLAPVISNYILKWQNMGFASESILLLAKICFKKYVRNFEDMDNVVSKYYAKGLVNIDAINDYISKTLAEDKKIKELLAKLELTRQVTSWDRDFYNTWKYVWKFSDELIDYAFSLAVGKSQPMQYVNKILSNWKEKNITTLDMAKTTSNNAIQYVNKVETAQMPKAKPEFTTHSFSSEELNALFDNLDEVKLI